MFTVKKQSMDAKKNNRDTRILF